MLVLFCVGGRAMRALLSVAAIASCCFVADVVWGKTGNVQTEKRHGQHRVATNVKRRHPAPAAEPILPDDPSKPLWKIWEANLTEFLKRSGASFGAFVAIEPSSGNLLVASEYSGNPKFIKSPIREARFPAASIFKIVTAAALLEQEKLSPETITCYHGGRSALHEAHLRSSPKLDRACQTLRSAFAHSTNAVFGKLAVKHLSPKVLLGFAERLGFNRKIVVGEFTTRSKVAKPSDFLDLARMAAGFTNSWLSPLHGAVLAAIIANGGHWPAQVAVDDSRGSQVLQPSTAEALKSMMVLTVRGGTAKKYLAALPGQAAVKTGTLTSRDGSGLFNTWVVGFYPANEPEIAFAAVVSSFGPGHIKAGHLARFALKTYVRLKRAREGRS